MIAEIIEYFDKESKTARLLNENRLRVLKKVLSKIDKEFSYIKNKSYIKGNFKEFERWNVNGREFRTFYLYTFKRPIDFLNTNFQIYDEYDLESLQKLYCIIPRGFLKQPSASILLEMPLSKIHLVSKYATDIAQLANSRYGEGLLMPKMAPKKPHMDIKDTFESV